MTIQFDRGVPGGGSDPGDSNWATVEELLDRTFGCPTSPQSLATLKKAENQRPEVKAFIGRAFRLMSLSKFSPRDISPTLAWAFGVMIPGLLPGAWGDVVPPFTLEHRHQRIDTYLATNPWRRFSPATVLLEMACGFPPRTAVDAARHFPDWQIIGADLQFDPYVLHDSDGNYACIDSAGGIRYFHPGATTLPGFRALYDDASATARRFSELFERLVAQLPPDGGESVSVSDNGARLVRHPIRTFREPNLTLIQAGIGADVPPADVIRIFNLLPYFDGAFRQLTEEWALRTLRQDGLFVCGSDGYRSLEARYTVYQKTGASLVPREFAFSLDNMRPMLMNAWFALHDDDAETVTLATLIGRVREDDAYRRDYDSRLDELVAEHRILCRTTDGFLALPEDPLPTLEWPRAREAIDAQLRAGRVCRTRRLGDEPGQVPGMGELGGHIAVDPLTINDFS